MYERYEQLREEYVYNQILDIGTKLNMFINKAEKDYNMYIEDFSEESDELSNIEDFSEEEESEEEESSNSLLTELKKKVKNPNFKKANERKLGPIINRLILKKDFSEEDEDEEYKKMIEKNEEADKILEEYERMYT